MEWIGVALIVFGLIWAGGFAFAHFRAAGKAKAAESWPTAAGTIVSCEVVEEESTDREGFTSTWYNPVVVYTYAAGGRTLEGRRLRFGNPRSGSRRKAEAALQPYRAGGSAPVRYNPDDTEECVLETRKPGPVYLVMAVFGLVFVAFGLFWTSLG